MNYNRLLMHTKNLLEMCENLATFGDLNHQHYIIAKKEVEELSQMAVMPMKKMSMEEYKEMYPDKERAETEGGTTGCEASHTIHRDYLQRQWDAFAKASSIFNHDVKFDGKNYMWDEETSQWIERK